MDNMVYNKVKHLLVEVLDLQEDQITPATFLYRDLHLESAETLELTFTLEQEFDISIGNQEFWNVPNVIANQGMYSNGKFSAEAVSLIRQYFNVSDEELSGIVSPYDLFNYVTVENMVDFVASKMKTSANS
ncbi:acyl carrier protein [Paenibacillus sp. sgz500958]|uniref:acyl carrier protein n=1 Tax=Paenibacillus sp. sgz500958 TaxID=3242475 RepID=UPI0036D43D1A